MLHLLTLAVINPGQGVAPPWRGQAHDDPAVDRLGRVRPVRRRRADQCREARALPPAGVRRREPAHHQPRVDAGRVRDRRVLSGDRRSAQLAAERTGASSMSDRSSTKDEASPERSPWSRPERAALRRVSTGARAARRRRRRHRRRRWYQRSRENADCRRLASTPTKATASGCAGKSGRQSDGPVEQPAAGAVGDGRVDAGTAEPDGLRTRALRRSVGDVLRAQSRPARCWPR